MNGLFRGFRAQLQLEIMRQTLSIFLEFKEALLNFVNSILLRNAQCFMSLQNKI